MGGLNLGLNLGSAFGVELLLAHSLRVLRAVRIALERAEVRRLIPRTSIQRVEEGRVDSKHMHACEGLVTASRMYMSHARGAMRRNSHATDKKSTGVKSQKQLSVPCTREFAVSHESWPCPSWHHGSMAMRHALPGVGGPACRRPLAATLPVSGAVPPGACCETRRCHLAKRPRPRGLRMPD